MNYVINWSGREDSCLECGEYKEMLITLALSHCLEVNIPTLDISLLLTLIHSWLYDT